jgi:hypothetical protein
MGRRTAGVLAGAALGLAACTGHGLATADSKAVIPQPPGDLSGTTWTVIGTGEAHAVPPAQRAVVHFTRRIVIARGVCRGVQLAFTDSGDATRGPDAPWSTVVCARSSPTATRYGQMLRVVDTAFLESGSLNLTGPHDVRLVLNPRNAAARDLVDG